MIQVATDTNKSIIKSDGSIGSSTKGEATSCSIVYEFFNPPYDDGDDSYDCDEKDNNEDDDENSVDYSQMTANDNHRLDKLLRKDFCRFMKGNLVSGTSATFCSVHLFVESDYATQKKSSKSIYCIWR